ncbi:MAG: hypothetical protein NKF70_10330 [Methanobacterium sp. ERen5]|nr:MAG: hypothetical protein NKF70_10330 [Methanobacterium sp. ERen5]
MTHDLTYHHKVPNGQEFSINTNENNAHDHNYQLAQGTHELKFVYKINNNKSASTTFYVVVI